MTLGICLFIHICSFVALFFVLIQSIFSILWVTNLLLVFNIPCEFYLRLTNYLFTSCLYFVKKKKRKCYLFNYSQHTVLY